MIPKKQEFARDTREFVRIGFNDACTDFRVQFNKWEFDTLQKCLADVSSYNDYRGTKVSKAFGKIKGLVYRASFGREGSPVLYLTVTRYERTPEQMAEAFREIQKAFEPTSVDENMMMDEAGQGSESTLRLWWD